MEDREGADYRSRMKYLDILSRFSRSIRNKPFNQTTKEGFKDFVYRKDGNYSYDTQQTYYTNVAKFFMWYLGKNAEYPRFIKEVRHPKRKDRESRYKPGDMWTQEEIKEAIGVLDHPRDKALVAVLHDTGAALHEILALKIEDISIKQEYVELRIPAKTKHKERPDRLTFSLPYLTMWLESHPFKNNRKGPLWIRQRGDFPEAIGHHALVNLCTKLKRRLIHRIRKPFNSYCWGRHSRITDTIRNERLNSEFQIKQKFGWTPDSRMLSRYVHDLGDEFSDDWLVGNGITIQKDGSSDAMQPIECYRCNSINPADAKYCRRCSLALAPEAIEEAKKEEQNAIQSLQERILFLEKRVLDSNNRTRSDLRAIEGRVIPEDMTHGEAVKKGLDLHTVAEQNFLDTFFENLTEEQRKRFSEYWQWFEKAKENPSEPCKLPLVPLDLYHADLPTVLGHYGYSYP